MIRKILMLLMLTLMWNVVPVQAQDQQTPVARRAAEIVPLLRGEGDPATIFAPAFLAQVPADRFRSITQQLTTQHGMPVELESVSATSPHSAQLRVRLERAVLSMALQTEANAPHRIIGLLVTGVEAAGTSLAALQQELSTLPGTTSLTVARLGDGAPRFTLQHNADQAFAIGSTFKLFILAELSRQVRAGERRWDQVVALDRRSLPSGILQTWPQGAPVTLHTLATLMISQSDNTATDILLHHLGRNRVEALLPNLGVRAAARNRPFLSTLDAFALKMLPEAEYRAWAQGDEASRRRFLAERVARTRAEQIDVARLVSAPNRIDTAEWFASGEDLVRTLDWLRRNGDPTARAIMAVNPGLGTSSAAEFAYVGFKGGSEPGVINLTYLVQDRGGAWHAVTGSWNNPAAAVDEARFTALISRAVQLARQP